MDWPTLVRFCCKFRFHPETGCWEWLKPDANGYGKFRYQGGPRWAHRVSYELFLGPIPAGLTLDHLCRNPRCINPDHLDPVTHRENVMRGNSPPAKAAARDTCAHGHPYTESNLYVYPNGARRCRRCTRIRLGRESADAA